MITAAEFRVALAHLDIPQHRFAEMVGYREETVSRWARGHKEIPRCVGLVLRLLQEKATEAAQ